MYRCLIIFLLIQISQCYLTHRNYHLPHNEYCKRGHNNYHVQKINFETIAQQMIDADMKLKESCTNGIKTKELFKEDFYEVIAEVPKCSEKKIEIKIKHRLLTIKVGNVKDFKILPHNLRNDNAGWYCFDDELRVNMLYNVTPKEQPFEYCYVTIDPTETSVSMYNPVIDVRLGFDNNTVQENVV